MSKLPSLLAYKYFQLSHVTRKNVQIYHCDRELVELLVYIGRLPMTHMLVVLGPLIFVHGSPTHALALST